MSIKENKASEVHRHFSRCLMKSSLKGSTHWVILLKRNRFRGYRLDDSGSLLRLDRFGSFPGKGPLQRSVSTGQQFKKSALRCLLLGLILRCQAIQPEKFYMYKQ